MHPVAGYLYAPEADHGLLSGAAPGAIVRNPDPSPPWLVIDHALESAIVTRWPGRLFRVEVLDTPGVPQASKHARYTRAVAIRVLEELPTAVLFGDHGEAVEEVLSFALRLDRETAERLAELRHPETDEAYSQAWRKWLDSVGDGERYPDTDFSGTLAAGSGPRRSPLNCGFTLIHRLVWDRAEEVVGPAAFVNDEDGERMLGPVWGRAAAALLDAAMALGAPSVVSEDEVTVLTAAWRSVTGS